MIRVLILDDDPLFGQTLSARLQIETSPPIAVHATSTIDEARQAVAGAATPFDVFLIDQNLGPVPDGIEVLQELRRLSPDTDGIIFTGLHDVDQNGLRAYKAGAYRYLAKPFDTRELIWILNSLHEKRQTEHERDWLRILAKIEEEAQAARSVREVADILVRGGLQLGFERARLWRLSADGQVLIGESHIGRDGLTRFVGWRMPMTESIYARVALESGEPTIRRGYEFGPGYLDRVFGAEGFLPPVGEWVHLPLWSGDRPRGVLTLDNVSQERFLRGDQRDLLHLFSRHVGAVLDQALRIERTERRRIEAEIINDIGRQVTERAALEDRDSLLLELRDQLAEHLDATNFTVLLIDEETGLAEVRLDTHAGRRRLPRWRTPEAAGLAGFVLRRHQSLLLSGAAEIRRFCRQYGVSTASSTPQCWLGVPLMVGQRAIGAMALQSFERPDAYTTSRRRLLAQVANEVAGVIHTAQQKALEAERKGRLEVIHGASEAILALADEGEDRLWQAVLTLATAGYGLGFSRAMLFRVDRDRSRLRGQSGVGSLTRRGLGRRRERERLAGGSFADDLQRLRIGRWRSSPIEKLIRDWEVELAGDDGSAMQAVLADGRARMVRASEVTEQLPQAFGERFGANDYALLPIRTGGSIDGLVVLDNAHGHQPIRPSAARQLEPLLAQAALMLEAVRQRRARDQLIELNSTIMAGVADRPLKETLTRVCEAVQTVSGADCVVLYPLRPGGTPYEFDAANIGAVGTESNLYLNSRLRQNGVTAHVLRSGSLVVPEVSALGYDNMDRRMVEHAFLRQERVCSFIGLRVSDTATGEPCGVLYLNYRSARHFTSQDLHQARSFASLAAAAIRGARAAEQAQADRIEISTSQQARECELVTLRDVLEDALVAATDHERVARTVLNSVPKLLELNDLRVGLLLRCWEGRADSPSRAAEVRREYFLQPDGTVSTSTEPLVYRGISGLALKTGQIQAVRDVRHPKWRPLFCDDLIGTRAELDAPIKLATESIGVISVESPHIGAFTAAHQAILARLATAAALALDNVQRQAHLHNVLAAARAMTAPLGLNETLQAIVDAACSTAPGVSTITTWYREPESGRIVLGPHHGVENPAGMRLDPPDEDRVVWKVMHEEEPIWAPKVSEVPLLSSRFVREERIQSCAAFPLRADNEIVGSIFISYREAHTFSDEERAILPLLAAVAAASIRDAARLEATRSERKRMEAALAITEALGTTLDLDQTLHKIKVKLLELLPGSAVAVLTYDENEHEIEFTRDSSEFYPIDHSDYLGLERISVSGDSLASRVARAALQGGDAEPEYVRDVSLEHDYLGLVSSTCSQISIALTGHEGLLGIMVVERPVVNGFSEDDITVVRSIAPQISTAIDRARKNADLRFQATVATTTAWAADIAHDINRELFYIRNRAAWLRSEATLSSKGLLYLREIDASAERLAGSVQPSPAPDRLHESRTLLLDEAIVASIEPLLAQRDVTAEWELGCPDVHVSADGAILRRILGHLVRNAMEAMNRDGAAADTPPTIYLRTQRIERVGRPWVEVVLENTGPPVPDYLIPALFSLPASDKGEGRGYGLLYVRWAVEKLGGIVRLRPPRAGCGACVAFRLPVGSALPEESNGTGLPYPSE